MNNSSENLTTLHKQVLSLVDPKRAAALQRFFKTGKGEYAEGDIFVGLTVPQVRTLIKEWSHLSLSEVSELLKSSLHEERSLALLILVKQYSSAEDIDKKAIYDLYLSYTKWINNWDLVDLSAPKIVGPYLDGKGTKVLEELAHSTLLWEKRIAMLATFHYICNKRHTEAFTVAAILLHDKHDLIHKAVGWMLREVGKRCGEEIEEEFLKKYYKQMPCTMLRYAIERFPEKKRQFYLAK
jgi:3-methyladenine DNA glycosylase AlkD